MDFNCINLNGIQIVFVFPLVLAHVVNITVMVSLTHK